ncbi:MAG: glycosyltransferase family 39 protein, partial [Nevskiales bacterium]
MTPSAPQRHRGLAVGIVALALTYFGLLAAYGLNLGEEGGTVYLIYRTFAGQRPYIDFISGYTPGYFYWHALVLRLLGVSLLPIRLCLVVVHTASALLLYRVSRYLVAPRYAVLPPLMYMALLPVVPATSCSFNVPYPSWYAVLFWLLGVHLLLRCLCAPRKGDLLVAGLLAGLSFSFKPNSGLFQLAATALCVVCACGARPAPERGASRWLQWSVMAGTLGGVAVIFRTHLLSREGAIFVAPIVALAASWLVHGFPADASAERKPMRAMLLLATGFGVVSAPWLLYFYPQLGWSRFTHDVLFVNTGYEQFFY